VVTSVGGSLPIPCASLTELFARVSMERPDAIAVRDGKTVLTYAALARAAAALAARLAARGVRPGDLVGVQVSRSVEAPVAILGILWAGGVYVPLDPAYPRERLQLILEDTGLQVIVGDSERYGISPGQFVPAMIDSSQPSPVQTAVKVDQEQPAYVIYTSGSTGRPKGCVITHRNVLSLLEAALPLFPVNSGDCWSMFHSVNFDVSVWELWGAFATGATLVIVPHAAAISSDELLNLILRERITVLNQVPSVFRALALSHRMAGCPPLSLRCLVFAGESVNLDVIKGFLSSLPPGYRPVVVNMYGITETTIHSTFKVLGANDLCGEVRSPIGKALPHLTLELRDNEGMPVPPGAVGEIWIGGAGVAQGYLHRPDLTALRFRSEGGRRFYRSGDMARTLLNGELEFLGRNDQQVKFRGFRLELEEIEVALRTHHEVQDAAATLWAGRGGDELLVAYIVARQFDPRSLRNHLQAFLPDYMIPARYIQLRALPLTPSGKLDRAVLGAKYPAVYSRAIVPGNL
jgi:amino acid adenylation domain-containing protein